MTGARSQNPPSPGLGFYWETQLEKKQEDCVILLEGRRIPWSLGASRTEETKYMADDVFRPQKGLEEAGDPLFE